MTRFQADTDRSGLFPLRRPDGEVRLVEYDATRDIQTGGHLSILRDVTERVEQERALEEQLERLDGFATMVSHDLRNLLNLAMAKLQLYRQTGEAEHYEGAVDALETTDQITGELLTLARRADDRGNRTESSLGAVARESGRRPTHGTPPSRWSPTGPWSPTVASSTCCFRTSSGTPSGTAATT